MDITVFGAGNLGLACCAKLSQENSVTLYTTRPHQPEETIRFSEEGQPDRQATFKVTDQMAQACEAQLVLCTYPAFLRQQFVQDVAPYLKPGTLLGFVPGYGGVEYFCQDLIARGVVVFGFQRVPYVCRSSWGDRLAHILSPKAELFVAALPKSETVRVAELMERLFSIPTHGLKEFLAVTLVPSNPLLHTTGSYGIFKDYEPGQSWDEQIMFYEQWNDDTSAMLLAYDDELQAICRALSPLDLSEVVSLRTYYESPDAPAMTRKLKSIKAFEVVKAPMAAQDDGTLAPNWNDRMFVEDYPFGVAIIKDIALKTGVPTPTVDTLLDFYARNTGIRYFDEEGRPAKDAADSAIPQNFGLDTAADLIAFYQS